MVFKSKSSPIKILLRTSKIFAAIAGILLCCAFAMLSIDWYASRSNTVEGLDDKTKTADSNNMLNNTLIASNASLSPFTISNYTLKILFIYFPLLALACFAVTYCLISKTGSDAYSPVSLENFSKIV